MMSNRRAPVRPPPKPAKTVVVDDGGRARGTRAPPTTMYTVYDSVLATPFVGFPHSSGCSNGSMGT